MSASFILILIVVCLEETILTVPSHRHFNMDWKYSRFGVRLHFRLR